MRIRLSLSLAITRAPKEREDQRDVDIAGTSTERLPEYEESGEVRVGFRGNS